MSITLRTEPFAAGVVCIRARESSGKGTLFSFNTALEEKDKLTSWSTYTGIGNMFEERTSERRAVIHVEEKEMTICEEHNSS